MDSTQRRAGAVVTPDRRVHLRDGLSRGRIDPTRLDEILRGAMSMTTHSTIVVDGASIAAHEQHADTLRRAGWTYTKIDAWTLYRRADGRTCSVGLRDEMGPRHFGVLFERDTDPHMLAMLLDRYTTLVGVSWRGTAATTAHAKIRLTCGNTPGNEPRWTHPKVGPGYASGPLIWSRALTETEQSWGWVHTFDSVSAYLGSAGNAELAWSTIEHTGPREFAKNLPGYWQVELHPDTLRDQADELRPPLIPPSRIRDGIAQLTTPMVWELHQLDQVPRVLDSWTATEKRGRAGVRILRPFAEDLNTARRYVLNMGTHAIAERLDYAIKRTHKDMTGGLQRAGMRVSRPDWAHTLIDLWRVTLYRRVLVVRQSQGVWPVAIKTDSLSYADCTLEPSRRPDSLNNALRVESCELGCGCAPRRGNGQLGTMKHEATHSVATWTEQHTPRVKAGAR